MQEIIKDDVRRIHNASIKILERTGVAFKHPAALAHFKDKGFKTQGCVVHFSETQIQDALETCPRQFALEARNPEKSLTIGSNSPIFLPGYGAPMVMDINGINRWATMEDYDDFCKLVQTSPHINMNAWMMVQPSNMPEDTVHLDMNLSNMLFCDKPFMASAMNAQGVKDSMEMAAILWGGKKALGDKTVSASLITPLSPLQISENMTGALMESARHNQACVISSLVMAGSSGPVTLAGVLALQNAEILAGITLAQLIRPGSPVIYGSTASAMDMKSGALAVGAPELSKTVHFTAQMAKSNGLPAQSGGGFTDSLTLDAQAGVESTLALLTAARSGIHFVLNACGIIGSHIAMGFEKFMVDEEICGLVKNLLTPTEISPGAIDVDTICEVGIGGQYLTHPKTFRLCRTEFHTPGLMSRKNTDTWGKTGNKRIDQIAQDKVAQRLAAYEKPDIEPEVEKLLTRYVENRKTS